MTLNTRKLVSICWASACWAFSFGVGTQVVSHWLHGHGMNDTVIGFAHAFYYLGQALGSFAVPWLSRRLGAIPCASFGLVLSGATLALFPWFDGIFAWYLLRFLNGWAGAMSLVPLETIVSRDSPPQRKTINFGYLGFTLAVGGALGIFLGLHFYSPERTLEFYVGGLIALLAGILLFVSMIQYRGGTELSDPSCPLGFAPNFLSFGTAWCQGFLEGGMLAFLSLFLLSRGFSADEAGVFMCITMAGVILFQVPVSWIADRYGRPGTLLGCYAVVALALFAIPRLSQENVVAIGVALFVFGVCSGAMYPLGLSMLGDSVPPAGLARAYAWYLAIECMGSQVGAALMGRARDSWGEASMFGVGLGALLCTLAIWLLLHLPLRQRHMPALKLTAKPHESKA